MNETKGARLVDRLKTAAEATGALLAKFRPKAAVEDPLFAERAALKAVELKGVRADRSAAKAAVKRVAAEVEEAAREAATTMPPTRRPR